MDRFPVIPAQAGIHESGAQAPLDSRFRGNDGGSPPPHCHPVDGHHCATCADEGIEALVLAIRDDSTAEVEMEGRVEEVATDLVDAVRRGDRILVHAGVAIARVEGGGELGAGRSEARASVDPRARAGDGGENV